MATVGGAWTSLGPSPITGEDNLCTSPPDYRICATYGTASGRISSLATNPTNPAIVYAGSAGGGVWKSTDSGSTWTPLTDNQPSLAIGALAVDRSGQIIFAGTGEDNVGDSQAGQGILKSTDGGSTWTVLGQTIFAGARIGGLAVDRTNANHVFAATSLGLYFSNDGGATWTSMVNLNGPCPSSSYNCQLSFFQGRPAPSGAAMDIIQAAYNPSTYWLSVSDFCNTDGGDILASLDGGVTFHNVTPPSITTGSSRIGLGVGMNAVYVSAADCSGKLNQIDKFTTTGWTQIPATAPGFTDYFSTGTSAQGDYDNVVAVDPTNSNQVVFGGITALATSDGGATFTDVAKSYTHGYVHPDFHAIAFTGASSLYIGNDGGVYRTSNLGGTGSAADWTNLNATLNTIQFYNGSALDTTHLLGGAQDNGTSGNFTGTASLTWPALLDGDCTFTAVDPRPGSHTIYAAYPGIGIERGSSTTPYTSFQEATPCRLTTNNTDPACKDPVAFVGPFALDPSNPQRLIGGTSRVWYSPSGGVPAGPTGWTVISGDLTSGTRFDPTGDVLQTLAMGPVGVAGPVMTGSRFGVLSRSTNSNAVPALADWAPVTGNLPPFPGFSSSPGTPTFVGGPTGWISGIAINSSNPKEVWVTIGGMNVGHVWHTTDAGQGASTAWADISGAVPNVPVNAITVDPATGIVYIGTDFGALVCTTCSGASPVPNWSPLGSGLPNVRVNALTVTQDGASVIAWTHGRGAWAIPVVPSPLLVVPSSLSFAGGAGAPTSAPQTLTITNRGATSLNWSLSVSTSSGGNWLSASPLQGTTAAGTSTPVTVTANPAGLTGGVYTGLVSVAASGGSAAVAVTLSVPVFPGQYEPLPPARILDTRTGTGGFAAPVGAGQVIAVQVAGAGGVPQMTDPNPPSAAVLNVTVTGATTPSYLTVYPTGVNRPLASNLNFVAGHTVPNLVEVALGPDGKVSVFNGAGSVHVIFDVAGWVSTQSKTPAPATAGLYRPLLPARLLDTRTSFGGSPTMTAGQTINLQVTGKGNVPATGVSAVVLNVTATHPSAAGFLTVFPTGGTAPSPRT